MSIIRRFYCYEEAILGLGPGRFFDNFLGAWPSLRRLGRSRRQIVVMYWPTTPHLMQESHYCDALHDLGSYDSYLDGCRKKNT